VEGRNGEVHHVALDVEQLSPALARFLASEEPPQESREGWDAVLTCRNEVAEIICQGARFGDGSDWGMGGTRIEVSDENSETLLSTRLNRKGELRFPRPDGKFHILMEDGPGQTMELNERDAGQGSEKANHVIPAANSRLQSVQRARSGLIAPIQGC
jgi:hypothetical protein